MIVLDEHEMRYGEPNYAGFGVRLAAYLIDLVALALIRAAISLLFSVPFMSTGWGILWFGNLFGFLYFVFLEAGSGQATIGKQVMKIKVVDAYGQRMTLSKSFIRNLSKILSSLILLIGFLLILFDDKKRGLHDMIAKTFVVEAS